MNTSYKIPKEHETKIRELFDVADVYVAFGDHDLGVWASVEIHKKSEPIMIDMSNKRLLPDYETFLGFVYKFPVPRELVRMLLPSPRIWR